MGPALLFCPADRPERFAKAAERSDAVILDLEDAVAPDAKGAARRNLAEIPLDPRRTIVRINSAGSAHVEADLEALASTPYRTLMLAKAESPEQLRGLAAADPGLTVIALCETALGVVNAAAIAAEPNVVALMWGAEDLVASLGGTSSRAEDGGYRAVALHARSSVLLAAGAFGKAAIDAVYTAIPDLDGLAAEAADAAASGFAAKACIHPNQVAPVRAAYAPSPAAVAAARELLAAADAAGTGVFQFEGRMIDGPILRHAEAVLRRAGEHPARYQI
ncbi:CoA ester lyase [Sinomonas sp. ASV322]|uniref:HpcH/HpaI aldolase/citrate lyase family protein n=1 Tax=Sinomonas sp. ASV322 TaxID=3041920 RepID=UPI0027DE9081|nr:CoA ester lyase [Sinomonas sp. ASV322]MDQ4502745.1 CoA ester lyase [Sinomonas sp. ASV322]